MARHAVQPDLRWDARAVWVIVTLGLVHRAIVFFTHSRDLDALIAANPDWYTFQHLPIPILRDQLGASLLYLQQTPPLSNLILGIVLKCVAWPYGVARALIACQAVLAIAAALMLMRTLTLLLRGRTWTSVLIAVAFLLGTDLLVIEYNGFGRTFYENLSMLLALSLTYCLLRLRRSGNARYALHVGILSAALALTRSTWSLFWAPAAIAVALVSGTPKHRALLAFALPVLLLQGGWTLKTRLVYGYWTPTTTSWTGYHLAKGLWAPGTRDAFEHFVEKTNAAREQSPRCHAFNPLTAWLSEADSVDRAIATRLGAPNPATNASSTRRYLDGCTSLFVDFALSHPCMVLRRTWESYRLFWLPPAQYGRMFVALLSPTAPLRTGLSPGSVIRSLLQGRLPARQFVMGGTWPRRRFSPTQFFTLRWLDPFLLLTTMIGVHVLAPIALVVRGLGRRGDRCELLLLLLPYVYLAGLSSLGEYGENMRFRIGVEPIVWLITVQSIVIVLGTRSLHHRRETSTADGEVPQPGR